MSLPTPVPLTLFRHQITIALGKRLSCSLDLGMKVIQSLARSRNLMKNPGRMK